MKKYSIFIIALMFISIANYAQNNIAHFTKNSTVSQTERTITFQMTLDNINNEDQKAQLLSKFKTDKEVTTADASAIESNKVVYTLTIQKANAFQHIENILVNAGIQEVQSDDGRKSASSEFAELSQAEFDKTHKKSPK